MTTQFIGVTFPPEFQWYADEVEVVNSVKKQIEIKFLDTENLLVNSTWLGPQFDNGAYEKLLKIANDKIKIDNIFLLSSIDPMFLNEQQVKDLMKLFGNPGLYKVGHFDDTNYEFNFHAAKIIPRHFKKYSTDELLLKEPKHLFLCYNRKPREHRVELVKKLIQNNLTQHGIVTLGANNEVFSKTADNDLHFSFEGNDEEYKTWSVPVTTFGDIPDDLHSLGNMSIWQNHFLTVVSETEFLPWDNMYVSEKTWKPIMGLRPFILNGQVKIYKWLRDNGFKTFNHYFNGIELENVNELEVHDSIVAILQYLSSLTNTEIVSMYNNMLPDLLHNRDRFFEFSKEQDYKIDNLFL